MNDDDIEVVQGHQDSLDGQSYAGSTDIFLMKFDASGAWQWTR